jgi:hypothetical protein
MSDAANSGKPQFDSVADLLEHVQQRMLALSREDYASNKFAHFYICNAVFLGANESNDVQFELCKKALNFLYSCGMSGMVEQFNYGYAKDHGYSTVAWRKAIQANRWFWLEFMIQVAREEGL